MNYESYSYENDKVGDIRKAYKKFGMYAMTLTKANIAYDIMVVQTDEPIRLGSEVT